MCPWLGSPSRESEGHRERKEWVRESERDREIERERGKERERVEGERALWQCVLLALLAVCPCCRPGSG